MQWKARYRIIGQDTCLGLEKSYVISTYNEKSFIIYKILNKSFCYQLRVVLHLKQMDSIASMYQASAMLHKSVQISQTNAALHSKRSNYQLYLIMH